jgi:hypothetical protein
VILFATIPVPFTITRHLPGPPQDPLIHLWTMKWYKSCLKTFRWPLFCPDLQYPVGAPLGYFPPMQLQTALYIPLSILFHNDALCYNLIWYFAFLYTGMATFALAWQVVRDRLAAGLAGLLVMLSTPLMMHSYGHLELMHLGGIPLFLWAWIRFVDRPGRGSLLAALAAYLLVAACAHYFVVLAVFPAALYAAWHASRAGWPGAWVWLLKRWRWLGAFAGIAMIGLMVLFAPQLASAFSAQGMERPRSEFLLYRAPLWGYLLPTAAHKLGRWLFSFNIYQAAGMWQTMGDRASYLGVVTLGLLHYAAVKRVRFARGSYWWLALGLVVLLSMGAYVDLGRARIPLPAAWLWQLFPPFRLIRVVSRFNMVAVVLAAVVAAAGLAHLLARISRPGLRVALVAILGAVAIVDQAMLSYLPEPVPALPDCYAKVLRCDGEATFLEIPQPPSGGCPLNAACAYWQSVHRGKTSAGYAAHANRRYDELLSYTSPFTPWNLSSKSFLAIPEATRIDLQPNLNYLDYTWLFLTVHGYKYVVLHEWPGALPGGEAQLEQLKALLAPARLPGKGRSLVYARSLLPAPSHPTLLCTEGWRERLPTGDGCVCVISKDARMALYNPDAAQPLMVLFQAKAFHKTRWARLRAGEKVLARWEVGDVEQTLHASPAFFLPAGLHELVLETGTEDAPASPAEMPAEGDRRAYSFLVGGVSLRTAAGTDSAGPDRVATRYRARQ